MIFLYMPGKNLKENEQIGVKVLFNNVVLDIAGWFKLKYVRKRVDFAFGEGYPKEFRCFLMYIQT